MADVKRTDKLVVVADESGKIRSALWPGIHSEGAPSETGVSLSEGQVAHEVDLPEELYESARPDLAGYDLQVDERGVAALRRSPES